MGFVAGVTGASGVKAISSVSMSRSSGLDASMTMSITESLCSCDKGSAGSRFDPGVAVTSPGSSEGGTVGSDESVGGWSTFSL